MRTRSEASNDRQSFVKRYQELLFTKVKQAQQELYYSLLEIIVSLDTDANGNIKNTVSNQSKQRSLIKAVERFNNGKNLSIAAWIAKRVIQLLDHNKAYFKSFSNQKETIDDRVRKEILKGLGYDEAKKELIKDGWLYNLTKDTTYATQAANLLNIAVSSKLPLPQFKKSFKSIFVGNNRLGLLERHFNTFAYDLFQRVDRTTQLEYADELELDYAIYQGTKIERTRKWCCQRIGRAFDRATIKKMNEETWDGKNESSNVETSCGGHKCGHFWDWVTKETAARRVGGEENINKLNRVRKVGKRYVRA